MKLRRRTVLIGIVVASAAMMFMGCRSSKPGNNRDKGGTTVSVKREKAELERKMSQVLDEIGLTLNRRLKQEEAQAARESENKPSSD